MLKVGGVAVLFLGLSLAFGQVAQRSAKTASNSNKNDGEQLFAENCGRCHKPPEQISPKVAGSVLRHMRVRAMLSQEDEQKILKYIAP